MRPPSYKPIWSTSSGDSHLHASETTWITRSVGKAAFLFFSLFYSHRKRVNTLLKNVYNLVNAFFTSHLKNILLWFACFLKQTNSFTFCRSCFTLELFLFSVTLLAVKKICQESDDSSIIRMNRGSIYPLSLLSSRRRPQMALESADGKIPPAGDSVTPPPSDREVSSRYRNSNNCSRRLAADPVGTVVQRGLWPFVACACFGWLCSIAFAIPTNNVVVFSVLGGSV